MAIEVLVTGDSAVVSHKGKRGRRFLSLEAYSLEVDAELREIAKGYPAGSWLPVNPYKHPAIQKAISRWGWQD